MKQIKTKHEMLNDALGAFIDATKELDEWLDQMSALTPKEAEVAQKHIAKLQTALNQYRELQK